MESSHTNRQGDLSAHPAVPTSSRSLAIQASDAGALDTAYSGSYRTRVAGIFTWQSHDPCLNLSIISDYQTSKRTMITLS